MKHNKIVLDCLIDHITGEPIMLYVPVDQIDRLNEVAASGYEAGLRFKEGLKECGVIDND